MNRTQVVSRPCPDTKIASGVAPDVARRKIESYFKNIAFPFPWPIRFSGLEYD